MAKRLRASVELTMDASDGRARIAKAEYRPFSAGVRPMNFIGLVACAASACSGWRLKVSNRCSSSCGVTAGLRWSTTISKPPSKSSNSLWYSDLAFLKSGLMIVLPSGPQGTPSLWYSSAPPGSSSPLGVGVPSGPSVRGASPVGSTRSKAMLWRLSRAAPKALATTSSIGPSFVAGFLSLSSSVVVTR